MRIYRILIYGALNIFWSLVLHYTAYAQENDSLLYSIYLVGDAGNATVPNQLLRNLKAEVAGKENAAIVFLGDNIYPEGLLKNKKNPARFQEMSRLNSQLIVLSDFKGHAFFIPGNHDWRNGKRNGLTAIIHQQQEVDDYVKTNTAIKNQNRGAFFPKGGFPGPVSFDLHDSLKLVLMDSQWWLQKDIFHPVSGISAAEHVFPQLDSILSAAEKENKRVLLAMHHPMFTNGNHARAYNPLRNLFYYTPLRILTVLGADRAVRQDIPDPRYSEMRRQILAAMQKHRGIIHVAGHDHNLQFFKGNQNYYVVSGSGSKIHKLYSPKYPSLFHNATDYGLMRIDYYKTGELVLKAFIAKEDQFQEVYRYQLN